MAAVGRRVAAGAILVAASALVLSGGCRTRPQLQRTLKVDAVELVGGQLEHYGVAFVTPSSVTGQEQDRQGVALLFARVLKDERPEIPVTTLAETLGEINEAGFHAEYKEMFEYYDLTGILPRETLGRIGALTGRRYIIMLKLASFQKDTRGRVSLLGIRFINTKSASLRLFCQFWDSNDGSIAWEANQEINLAYDSATEDIVTFDRMVEVVARDLVERLPEPCPEAEAAACQAKVRTGLGAAGHRSGKGH